MTNQRPRQAGFTSLFKPAWDYNYETLENNIILPTIRLFPDQFATVSRENLVVSHNNFSHTERLGLIESHGNMVGLTDLGRELLNGNISFENILRSYLPTWNVVDQSTGEAVYPYMALAFCLSRGLRIRKIDFMFGLYHLTNTSPENLERSVREIENLRIRYPIFDSNASLLTDAEKTDLLNELNDEYNTSYVFRDLWTASTTVTNRYNYFMNHLSVYHALSRDQRSFRAFNFSDLFTEE